MQRLTTTKGQNNLPKYFRQAFAVLRNIRHGALEIALPDGRVFRVEGPEPGPVGHIDVVRPEVFTRLVRDGDLGFSDAYLEGDWTSPDLQTFLDVVLMNNQEIAKGYPGSSLLRAYERLRHWMNTNTRAQAQKNIAYHYDLGNDFYGLWLDETMTYSSALFTTGQEDLAKAQTAKYASLCDEMGMKEGDHLLEIGCGWGGFAEYAAGTRGAKMTCLTISQEQHDFAKERMFKAGLAGQVDIAMRDYRDETGEYDGIASIEMFEAVGEKYWPTYFQAVHDCLKPGANATLQVITMGNELYPRYRKTVDFIQKHIFPGGMLPSPDVLRHQIDISPLEFVRSREFGESYSLTLRRWHAVFNQRWGEIAAMGFDEKFRNMWNYYLTSCAAGFHAGTTDVTQVTVQRRS
ncbi:MAG: cyclopropane-fatty-acyl-phospholipid synthase family protein [Rhodobacteraceae bacterium]|nr:cyclopropane-fatty-acyl-phospholipid synthase family protein [Paracoccaceae bacterium]